MKLMKYYYMVKVSVKNASNKNVGKEGVALGMAMLVGKDYTAILSPEAYTTLNPKVPPILSFSLLSGKKKELWIAYDIIPGNAPSYGELLKDSPLLQITQYPHHKLLWLS